MPAKVFFDTNILVYAATRGDPRTEHARELLTAGGFISVQLLNELVAVLRSAKFNFSWAEVNETLADIREACQSPVALTLDLHEQAIRLAARYRYRIYDALVIAAALDVSAEILYSEDMRSGQKIESLQIVNPFQSARPVNP